VEKNTVRIVAVAVKPFVLNAGQKITQITIKFIRDNWAWA
jgi:hypothetical protein